jgi:predicted GNAT family acetyltransferase
MISFYNKNEHALEASELVELYTAVGWNKKNQRTVQKTQAVLDKSPYYVQARHKNHLVGFGRVIEDPYFAIILDLITHPDYRRQGIAIEILRKLVAHCRSQSLPMQLVDGSGTDSLYEKVGFKKASSDKEKVMYLE